MDYKNLPLFKGITPDAEVYLDRFDKFIQMRGIQFEKEDILIRKADLYCHYVDYYKNLQKGKYTKDQFIEKMDKELKYVILPNSNISLVGLMRSIYSYRRDVHNEPISSAKEYSQMIEQWRQIQNGLSVSTGQKIEGQEVATGWVYKESPQYRLNKKAGKPLHRFILNVDPSKELLDKLDKFALKYACQYKCAEDMQGAYNRPDTMVIYTADERAQEQQNELKNLVAPYVRRNGDELLDGVKIADGLYTAPEPQKELIEQLEKRARVVYPRLADLLKSELDNNKKLSLGEFTIYEQLCESVALEKGISDKQQQVSSQNTILSILQEGIYVKFLSPTSRETGLSSEMLKTDRMFCKIDEKNPDIMNMNGLSNSGNSTFAMQYNRKTHQYIYQGGKPEKIYSNDPTLNKENFPKEMNNFMKRNFQNIFTAAQTKKQIKDGVEFIDAGKKIRVSLLQGTEKVDIKVCDEQGLPSKRFIIDQSRREYLAKDFKTGKIYSNVEKYKQEGANFLSGEILKKYLNLFEKAKNIARTNNMMDSRGNDVRQA